MINTTEFKVGDKAVYPAVGVGVIKKIESIEAGGKKLDFYVLQMISSGVTLRVPVSPAGQGTGLRSLMSDKEIRNVYSILKSPGTISRTTWNRRFRKFNEKLTKGSIFEIAEVLRDLNSLQGDKDLSFGERDMMDKAKGMIVSEISAALSKDEESIEKELEKILVYN